MLFTYLEGILQLALAMAFGWAFGLGELLERRGYRWFRGAPLALGAATGLFGVGMLWLSLDGVRGFWLASLAAWILAGRMFTPGKLVAALALSGYLALWTVRADNLDLPALAYLGGALALVSAAQALARRATHAPRWLSLLAARERWAAYAVVAGYVVAFELDLALIGTVWAFHSTTATFEDEARLAKLGSWGIRRR
ncbi:MAG: hypothetical protein KF729_02285 [Sandaracinaceae bacterium]|nr:hypothetical protein [Sandaracinaceae bacterium]